MADPVAAGGRWPSTLHGRLALGALLSTAVSLVVFAVAAYVVVLADELSEPSDMTPAQINWETGREVLMAMAVAMPLSLLIAAGGSLWLSRRVLAPLDQIVRSAREMTAHDLERRLPLPPADDELRALVLAQNALFARLDDGFKALSRFASDASHELRTPLTVIGNELEIALRRPRTPEEWRGAAERSLDELRRLHRLVEALIELARADAASPIADGRVGARSLVAELVSKLAPAAASAGIELRADSAEGGEIWLHGSEEALRVALSNLLSNALRYTPRGGRISAAAERNGAAALVAIHVDDSGPGVDPREAEAIFTPFVRGARGREADERESDGRRGLGLGLSIAKRIVERHRGTLSVRSSSSGGARFTIELPAATAGDGA
jgi:signal transduction histidine kinase